MALQKREWNCPQWCPSCRVPLVDTAVPEEYAQFQGAFTLALSEGDEWVCPVCGFRWARFPSQERPRVRPGDLPMPKPRAGMSRADRRAMRKQQAKRW